MSLINNNLEYIGRMTFVIIWGRFTVVKFCCRDWRNSKNISRYSQHINRKLEASG